MNSTNWIRIAEARGIPVPTDPSKLTAPLDALQSALYALVAELPFETEPAVILSEPAVLGQ